VKLEKLRYQGDIKVYLTAFRALNIHAGSNGQGLQRIIDLAMPDNILEMRASQFRGVLNDDEGFLSATYEAGKQVEHLKALKVERTEARGGQPRVGGAGSGSTMGKDGKDYSRRQKDQKEDRGQSGQRAQTTRQQEPASGRRWEGTNPALEGVPRSEVAKHKEAKASCWRCGYNSHHTHFCYARKTIGGTDLPEAPAAVSGATSSKRQREVEATKEAPRPKQARTAAAQIEDDDMRETIPVWAEDSEEEEENFEDCADF